MAHSNTSKNGTEDFDSLTTALQGWFDKPLAELPERLQERIERDFFPLLWDSLTLEQRKSAAQQRDYQHDPATERDREFWFNFYADMEALKKQIDEWEAVAAQTASELAQKEGRLRELNEKLAAMKRQESRSGQSQIVQSRRSAADGQEAVDTGVASAHFVPYPKALEQLARRLDSSPEELAAWVWMGPDNGGLAAYLNANELDSPPRFYYDYIGEEQSADYLAPLMACWFRADEIAKFEPIDRFITGKALIERWGKYPGIRPEAFVRAKIAESRLLDIHPISGGTQAGFPEDTFLPPLESGLYVLSHVEAIEAADFGADTIAKESPQAAGRAESPVGSPKWRIENARAAANARHNRPGGSREKQRQIRELWASGKYETRDSCAEDAHEALGMSYSAARIALRGTPEPKRCRLGDLSKPDSRQ